MSKNNDITYEKEYKGYPINTNKNKNQGCHTKTLEQITNQVEYTTQKHSKVLNVRLDIRNPVESEKTIERKDMTRILETTRRNLESTYKHSPNKVDLQYVWTTENESESRPHFHMLASVNGNAIQNGYALLKAVNDSVKHHLKTDNEGLVEFCESNGKQGKMIDRNSPDFIQQKQDVVYQGSYLAKVRSKENRPKGSRVSSASRLPKAPQQD